MEKKIDSPLTFLIAKNSAGQRLDQFLNKKIPDFSRSHFKKLIENGDVTVNESRVKPAHLLKVTERIVLQIPPAIPLKVTPQEIPLDILYEDEHLLVLNKSAEMISHPGAGVREGTLVNALLHHCQNLPGIGGVMRPGIVHRLDKGTSGVMVVAKDDLAHHALSAQFKAREVEKKYLAFVWGKLRQLEGTIDIPMGRSSSHRKKISTKSRHTRHAVTRYHVLKQWEQVSLVELTPLTGRTHQIRVHLSEIGHPLIGDPVYGKGLRRISALPNDLQEVVTHFAYQLLHASSLNFFHPLTKKKMTFTAAMRREMLDFQKLL